MVYFFTIPEGYVLYMGKDKYENEELIKYAWKEDVWFHVDDLSSAHVYLRLKEEFVSFDQIPPAVVEKCAQLTKANSIEGSKKAQVDVIYTPASNLKKTIQMEVGAVGYHNHKLVKTIEEVEKNREMLKAIEKTQKESFPDLADALQRHEDEKRLKLKSQYNEQKKAQKELEKVKNQEKAMWEEARKQFEVNNNSTPKNDPDDDFI